MAMLTKSVPFELKAGGEKGTFEALVAVFGNVDSVGDRIVPGAFAKTLSAWRKSGDPIPVIFNHDWADAHAHIGVVNDAVETKGGLLVKGTLDIADNPVAKQVHKLMQRRSLKEFSFGYRVPAGGERRLEDGINELIEIDLAEVGPTLKGANPATELHAVKSALGVEDPPRTASEQDAAAKRLEQEVEAQQVPEIPEGVYAEVVEPPKPVVVPKPEPKSDAELRKQAARVEREMAEQRTPEVTEEIADAEIVEEDGRALADEVADLKATVAELVEAMKPKAPDPAELLAEAKRVEREVEQAKIPDDVAPPDEAPAEPENTELQEIKTVLAEVRQAVDDLKKNAEETDKATIRSRSVDPLRERAEAVALEVAHGGTPRKPPNPVAPQKLQPRLSMQELKEQMRNELVYVLSGGTE